MIELTRFFLSAVVMQSHIWPLHAPWLAHQSVFGFYTLSGFLMTRVLNERYGFSPSGLSRFVVNRVLRLWPTYLIVLSMTAACIWLMHLDQAYWRLHFPRDLLDTIANVSVVGLVSFDFRHELAMTLMVPNAWSLSIELVCYALLATYFGRSPRRLFALGIIGIVALGQSTVECMVIGAPAEFGRYCFQSRYGVLQAGFIPFAVGGLLHFYEAAWRRLAAKSIWLIVPAICVIMAAIATFAPLQFTVSPFVGCLIVATLIIWLPSRKGEAAGLMDFLGRASYHLFIAHWLLAAVLVRTGALEKNTFLLCAATLVFSLLLSAALVPIEHRIQHWRRRIAPIKDCREAAHPAWLAQAGLRSRRAPIAPAERQTF